MEAYTQNSGCRVLTFEEQVRVAASRTGWDVVKLEPWEHEGKETGWVLVELRRRKPR